MLAAIACGLADPAAGPRFALGTFSESGTSFTEPHFAATAGTSGADMPLTRLVAAAVASPGRAAALRQLVLNLRDDEVAASNALAPGGPLPVLLARDQSGEATEAESSGEEMVGSEDEGAEGPDAERPPDLWKQAATALLQGLLEHGDGAGESAGRGTTLLQRWLLGAEAAAAAGIGAAESGDRVPQQTMPPEKLLESPAWDAAEGLVAHLATATGLEEPTGLALADILTTLAPPTDGAVGTLHADPRSSFFSSAMQRTLKLLRVLTTGRKGYHEEHDAGTSADPKTCPELCTYSTSGSTFQVQHWYNCFTCGLQADKGCCTACALQCHAGHDIQ